MFSPLNQPSVNWIRIDYTGHRQTTPRRCHTARVLTPWDARPLGDSSRGGRGWGAGRGGRWEGEQRGKRRRSDGTIIQLSLSAFFPSFFFYMCVCVREKMCFPFQAHSGKSLCFLSRSTLVARLGLKASFSKMFRSTSSAGGVFLSGRCGFWVRSSPHNNSKQELCVRTHLTRHFGKLLVN